MKFDVKYYNGEGIQTHFYTENWSKTEYYCPNCGRQYVWEEDGEGDYYVGSQLMCTCCGVEFNLPSGASTSKYNQDLQRLAHLREGEANTPE